MNFLLVISLTRMISINRSSAHYSTILKLFFFQDVVSYQMTSSKMSQGACLDNNHTHFILVDDGTINKFGGEISFRASLENCISRKQMEKSCGKKRIIVILLFISVLVVVNPCPNSIVYVGRSMIDSGS